MEAPNFANASEQSATLSIGADISQLYIVRALAGVIATRVGFDLDAVEDIRLAVDEIVTRLITVSDAGSEIRCTFSTDMSGMVVVATAPCATVELSSEPSFRWHVVEVLTDSFDAKQTPNLNGHSATRGAANYTTTITISKRRAGMAS
jgi:serine/threonine-protein kinase RsbW